MKNKQLIIFSFFLSLISIESTNVCILSKPFVIDNNFVSKTPPLYQREKQTYLGQDSTKPVKKSLKEMPNDNLDILILKAKKNKWLSILLAFTVLGLIVSLFILQKKFQYCHKILNSIVSTEKQKESADRLEKFFIFSLAMVCIVFFWLLSLL